MTILLRSNRADSRGKFGGTCSANQYSYVYLHIDLDGLTDERLSLQKTPPIQASEGFPVRHVTAHQMTNGIRDERKGVESDG